ncbi:MULTISPECIES: surface-adhesin E family protein [unclassified Paraburkholderia]|uniref:surface-adhesin E family protein n=1 Tax=unclassified Paraburkholderia TaxID=2615204 RepID=UPI002AB1C363|nr:MULTISPECIES: surface-adhesin E family protein [unclassified Paraburkholderia]
MSAQALSHHDWRRARRLLTCLAVASAALAASAVHAAGWTTVASVPNRWTESVNTDSIVREGAIRRAWIQIRYAEPTAISHALAPVTLLKQRIAFDCKKHQTSLTSRLSYDAQGQLLDRVDTLPTVSNETFTDVEPDTELDRAFKFVCAS